MHDESLIVPVSPDAITYNSYLKIPALIDLQKPLSSPVEHDEMLFIVIHQVYELWFKQILHEVNGGVQALARNGLMEFVKGLKRITAIQDVLVLQVNVLETMTPNDFNRFRDKLNPASGFQSFQFRLTETVLGCKDENYLKFFKTYPEALRQLTEAMGKPSLYDHFLRMLDRRGLKVPKDVLERDVSKQHESSDGVRDLFVTVYQNPEKHSDLYLALEALMDVDQKFSLWRFRHVAMVERMIGNRRGTGGSSGVRYLTKTMEKRLFPELWDARNYLGTGYGS